MLAQSYAIEILGALAKKPMRFTDLEDYGPNERTRSQRLKELEGRGLVTTTTLKIGRRPFVHYTLTDRGRVVLEKVRELSEL